MMLNVVVRRGGAILIHQRSVRLVCCDFGLLNVLYLRHDGWPSHHATATTVPLLLLRAGGVGRDLAVFVLGPRLLSSVPRLTVVVGLPRGGAIDQVLLSGS